MNKLFDDVYYAYRLHMFLRESRELEEDIKKLFYKIRALQKRDVKHRAKGYDITFGLRIEPSRDSFTSINCSEVNSGGLIKDQEVVIGNSVIPVDFQVMDIPNGWKTSLLLGRAFMATVGAVCNMQDNKLCLTLVDMEVF
ncbi:hypothetical protein F2Q70_00027139 [Brassica cretica]|uniref:Uncharacterized protein n=1 Tax=Brassica cretica TaxID=69181 RepID=A0A8S9LCE7_BRACR|nr:hypothetical protein F2Q70_00027139 [Brassica cretica]